MTDLKAIKDDLVFGLDIGTRSIVGVVGYLSHQVFHVVAMAEEKHATRAMLDGQIHDIYKVGDTIRRVKTDRFCSYRCLYCSSWTCVKNSKCIGRVCI